MVTSKGEGPQKGRSRKGNEDFADFVRRKRSEKELSLKDVERNSGNQISSGYVSQIENRYVVNVTPERLRALAKGLGISDDEIFAAVRGKRVVDDSEFIKSELGLIYEKRKTLLPEDQREIDVIIEMLLHDIERRQQRHRTSLPRER